MCACCNRQNSYLPQSWKSSRVGTVLCGAEAQSPLATRVTHSVGIPCVGCLCLKGMIGLSLLLERWSLEHSPGQLQLCHCTGRAGLSCLSLPVAALSLSGVGWVQGTCLAHCSSIFAEVGQSSEHSSGPVVAWVLCGVGKCRAGCWSVGRVSRASFGVSRIEGGHKK